MLLRSPPIKFKVTPNAADLAMDVLLSSQTRKHRWESAYYQFKTTNSANTTVTIVKKLSLHQKTTFLLNFMWC